MPKVAHIFMSFPIGGAEELVLWLARYSPGTHHILCISPQLGPLGEEAQREGLPIHHLPLVKDKRLSPFAALSLSRHIKQHGYTHIHTHVYNAHIYGALASLLTATPHILHHHKTFEKPRLHRRALMHLILRHATHRIALSGQTAEDLRRFYRLAPESFTTLPNPLLPPPNNGDIKAEEIPGAEVAPLLGSIASLNIQKNHPLTIRALALLHQSGIQAHCIILGEGPQRPHLRQLIDEHHLAPHIRLPGNRRPITPWLNRFDLFILPSTWEGQPLALLQALAHQRPILASDIEGNTAILGTGHPGLFPPDSPERLASLIEKFLRQPDFKAELLRSQNQAIENLPTPESYLSRLDKLYAPSPA